MVLEENQSKLFRMLEEDRILRAESAQVLSAFGDCLSLVSANCADPVEIRVAEEALRLAIDSRCQARKVLWSQIRRHHHIVQCSVCGKTAWGKESLKLTHIYELPTDVYGFEQYRLDGKDVQEEGLVHNNSRSFMACPDCTEFLLNVRHPLLSYSTLQRYREPAARYPGGGIWEGAAHCWGLPYNAEWINHLPMKAPATGYVLLTRWGDVVPIFGHVDYESRRKM